MTSGSDQQKAERLGERRARMIPVLTIIYLSQQISYFSGPGENGRAVDHVRLGTWVVLSLLLLAILATGGFWFHKKTVRALIDDELTRANRLDSLGWGFIATIVIAVILYFLQTIQPIITEEAIHVIVSTGLGIGLLRFAFLERRAHS